MLLTMGDEGKNKGIAMVVKRRNGERAVEILGRVRVKKGGQHYWIVTCHVVMIQLKGEDEEMRT